MTTWCMSIACWIPKSTNTHSEHATMVARTRLNVTLQYTACLVIAEQLVTSARFISDAENLLTQLDALGGHSNNLNFRQDRNTHTHTHTHTLLNGVWKWFAISSIGLLRILETSPGPHDHRTWRPPIFCYGNTWKNTYTGINDTQYMRLRVRFCMKLQP
jgi:hypothetical protein